MLVSLTTSIQARHCLTVLHRLHIHPTIHLPLSAFTFVPLYVALLTNSFTLINKLTEPVSETCADYLKGTARYGIHGDGDKARTGKLQ